MIGGGKNFAIALLMRRISIKNYTAVYEHDSVLFGSCRKTHGFWAIFKNIPNCVHYLSNRFHPMAERIAISIEGMHLLQLRVNTGKTFKTVVFDEPVQNLLSALCKATNGNKLWKSLHCLVWFLQNAEHVIICGQDIETDQAVQTFLLEYVGILASDITVRRYPGSGMKRELLFTKNEELFYKRAREQLKQGNAVAIGFRTQERCKAGARSYCLFVVFVCLLGVFCGLFICYMYV
jgi:hypothetical protein